MPPRRPEIARARLGAAVRALRRARLAQPVATPPVDQPTDHAAPASDELVVRAVLTDLVRERPPMPFAHPDPISSLLHARLTAEDHAELQARLDGPFAELWAGAGSAAERQRLSLTLAAHFELPGALERTGLTSVMPPPEIHAMAQGPLAAGGDPWLADAMVGAMEQAGFVLPDGATVLDFGCSSGRILRTIAAARPDLECVGCDPNEPAIRWATEHLPTARFFVSPARPPLSLATGSVDAAYAVSIWSHFAQAPALEWLDDMHRVVRPGGVLVLTTHGLDSVAQPLRNEQLSETSAAEATTTMLRGGLHFIDVFGEAGDWGVVDAEWGNAYFTLDWLAANVTPKWSVDLYRPGGLDGNQDLVVLGRMERSVGRAG